MNTWREGEERGEGKSPRGQESIPVIASGGCGSLEHFAQVFEETNCDAALAASLFHFGELTVPQVKDFLRGRNIPVRR